MTDIAAGTALAVVAHPDDVEFNFGGTVALWMSEGWRVFYCVITRGDKGSEDPAMTSSQLAGVREAEQRQAADWLGAAGVDFLGYEDGGLEASPPIRRDIARVIRQRRPQRLLTTDPLFAYDSRYINHPDHIAAAQATLAATYAARDRLTVPELLAKGLEPHAVHEVWIHDGGGADRFVDITTVLDRKTGALRIHASQISDAFVELAISRARATAERAPDPRPEYAEAFRVVQLS